MSLIRRRPKAPAGDALGPAPPSRHAEVGVARWDCYECPEYERMRGGRDAMPSAARHHAETGHVVLVRERHGAREATATEGRTIARTLRLAGRQPQTEVEHGA